MLLHNMGVELAIWSVAMMLFSGKIGKEAMMKMVNGPTIMVLVSLLINALSLDLYIPGLLTQQLIQLVWRSFLLESF